MWDPVLSDFYWTCAEFLAFARNLFEQVFIPGGGAQPDAWSCERSAVPLESDERFLKYLQLHNYDLETAKLRLLSDLGAGTGVSMLLRQRVCVCCVNFS